MDNVGQSEKEKLDELFAEFIYGCNISFLTCESKYFKQFMQALRPAYAIPNRKKLAGPLLDKVHQKIENQNLNLAQSMDNEAVLLIDGWTNSSSNHHNVVTMMATADDKKVFLESYNISETNETSENLCFIVNQAVELAKTKYNTKIYAVVSDNARNMTCMGGMLQAHAGLMFTTCHSHIGNLLAKDLIELRKYSTMFSKVMVVQKDFKRAGLEATLKKSGGKKAVSFFVMLSMELLVAIEFSFMVFVFSISFVLGSLRKNTLCQCTRYGQIIHGKSAIHAKSISK